MVYGGGTDRRTDGRMDGQEDRGTDVSKFLPVFYRTLAFWGRCPKSSLMVSEHADTDGQTSQISRFY